jgi:hypothetical protein
MHRRFICRLVVHRREVHRRAVYRRMSRPGSHKRVGHINPLRARNASSTPGKAETPERIIRMLIKRLNGGTS